MMTMRKSGLTARNGTTIPDGQVPPLTILHTVEVDLQKGGNVLLYRCGESGGSAYLNLHFDDATNDAVDIYPTEGMDAASFLDAVRMTVDVEPAGKLATTWADIKQSR